MEKRGLKINQALKSLVIVEEDRKVRFDKKEDYIKFTVGNGKNSLKLTFFSDSTLRINGINSFLNGKKSSLEAWETRLVLGARNAEIAYVNALRVAKKKIEDMLNGYDPAMGIDEESQMEMIRLKGDLSHLNSLGLTADLKPSKRSY